MSSELGATLCHLHLDSLRPDPCMHIFSEEVRGEDLEPHSWGSAGS